MSIETACPACMAINEIDDDLAGTKVRCDECGKTFTAPSARQAKKTAQAKTKESPEESTGTLVRRGPPRQQLIASIVMAFLSLLALGAIAGLGIYSFWTSTQDTKPPPAIKPKTPTPDPKKASSTGATDRGQPMARNDRKQDANEPSGVGANPSAILCYCKPVRSGFRFDAAI